MSVSLVNLPSVERRKCVLQPLDHVASVADPKAFKLGRDYFVWVELVPTQNSSGGEGKLGSIEKRGRECRGGSPRWLRSWRMRCQVGCATSRKNPAGPHRACPHCFEGLLSRSAILYLRKSP